MRIEPWKIAALAVVSAAPIFASACGGGGGEEATPTTDLQIIELTATGSITPRPRRTPTPSVPPSPTPLEVCAPNPDPAAPAVLQIEEPKPEQQVHLPVHVRGWGSNIGAIAVVPTDTVTPTPAAPVTTPFARSGVTLAIVDQRQAVVQVNELPALPREYRVPPRGLTVTDFTRPFAADIVLPNVTEPTPYCLWIYLSTTASGRAQQVVQVPVVILPAIP